MASIVHSCALMPLICLTLAINELKKTEAAKTAKREVRRGERDIEKELRNLERSEKSLISDIKKTAKGGNQVSSQGKWTIRGAESSEQLTLC